MVSCEWVELMMYDHQVPVLSRLEPSAAHYVCYTGHNISYQTVTNSPNNSSHFKYMKSSIILETKF